MTVAVEEAKVKTHVVPAFVRRRAPASFLIVPTFTPPSRVLAEEFKNITNEFVVSFVRADTVYADDPEEAFVS